MAEERAKMEKAARKAEKKMEKEAAASKKNLTVPMRPEQGMALLAAVPASGLAHARYLPLLSRAMHSKT